MICLVAAISAYLEVRGRDPGPFFHFQSGVERAPGEPCSSSSESQGD